MKIDPKILIYLNKYPDYLASQAHMTFDDARKACNNDPNVETIRYRLDEDIMEEPSEKLPE